MDSIIAVASSALGLFSKLNFYILIPVLLAVSGFVVSYLRNYQWPAQLLSEQLSHVISQIKAVRAERGLSLRAMEDKIDFVFEQSPFSHLWAEYRQSLHTVHVQDSDVNIKSVLATVPAETFFSKESIIDLQINADFYRHLPGILTGIGIIGTFSGLVWGLHEFRPDPGQALDSLPLLLQEVTSAFIGSGCAILAAIFITYKEKSILNHCYRLVEEMNKEIDSLHAMGTGEEYLSRLVRASENSPANMAAFKDSLMEDMSRLMYGVVERQTLAQQQQNERLSAQISEAIRVALAEPMAKLSGVVQDVSGSQNEAVGGLLENLLQGFMGKMGDALGRQIEGINSSLESSSNVMGQVQSAMTKSIDEISAAGMTAADRMSDRLEDSLSRAVAAQQELSAQMLRQQQQSAQLMDETIARISGKLEETLSQVVSVQVKSSEMTDTTIDRISGRLEDSLAKVMTAQEQINLQTLQQQHLASEMMGMSMKDLSGKLEDSLARVVSVQEQINLQVQSQQQRSSELANDTIDRISGKLEDSLARVVAAQEEINLQTLRQQQQSTELMDMALGRISGKLEDSLAKVVAVQEQMNLQTLQQQKQASDAAEAALRAITEKLQLALGAMAEDRSRQIDQDKIRHETLLGSAQALYAGLSDKVGGLVDDIRLASARTGENLSSIQQTTLQAITGMRDGADVMRGAADRFTASSDAVSGLIGTMAQTATTMQQTVDSVHRAFAEYDKSRDAVQQYVSQLQGNLDLVRKENGVSKALVEDMERIVASLAGVERESKEYMERINEVLKRSFQDFGVEMVGQVRNISAESNRQLGSSLQALSSTVDSMISSVTKLRRAG